MKASEIPESYRVTESDNDEAWKLFADRDKYFAASDEERNLVGAFMEAGHMKHKSGVWPTLGEVYEQWQHEEEERERQREERERKHAALMQVWNGRRANHKSV